MTEDMRQCNLIIHRRGEGGFALNISVLKESYKYGTYVVIMAVYSRNLRPDESVVE